jgi:phosphate transport system protein
MEREHTVTSFDEDLNQLKAKVVDLGAAAQQQIADVVKAITTADSSLATAVIHNDEIVNNLQFEVEERVVQLLAQRQPVAVDLRAVIAALKISSELERIADYAANIVKNIGDPSHLSGDGFIASIHNMVEINQEMLKDIMSAYVESNSDKAVKVWHRDDAIDAIYAKVLGRIRNRLKQDTGEDQDYTSLVFAARCCERIGDHITNVAENIYFIEHGKPYIDSAVMELDE